MEFAPAAPAPIVDEAGTALNVDSSPADAKPMEVESVEARFAVMFAGGTTLEVSVPKSDTVKALRGSVEQKHDVPPACIMKLFQGQQILLDSMPIGELSMVDPVFAVVARETNLEVLLQAAGTYNGYKELLRGASPDPDDINIKVVGPMPSILAVLEDMSGQAPNVPNLCAGSKDGSLEFSGADGALLLPSLDATPWLAAAGVDLFKSVTIVVEVNSDSYNRGLGVVLEASPLMDVTIDESGFPSYVYNGLGISSGKQQNAVKFHPGMGGGQARVEGVGGFGNSSMGFTPLNWSESGKKYHTFELNLGADGTNEVCIKGTSEGQVWRRPWKRTLTSGKHIPAVYAWLDLGGEVRKPLQLGQIHVRMAF